MSRQRHWHASLLPALVVSLLLHSALLPLWQQPLLLGNTALPSLQITLRGAPKAPLHPNNPSGKPQTAASPNTVSSVPANQPKTSENNPNSRPSSHKPALEPTKVLVSAPAIPTIQRPDRRLRTRPLRKPAESLPRQPQPRQPQPVIQRVPRKRSTTRIKPAATITAPPARSAIQSTIGITAGTSPAAVSTKTTNSASKSQVLAWLNREIRKYFSYPGIARRRNLEGTVLLRFAVEQNGRIADVRIAQSSGAGILDRAALASLQKLASVTLPLAEKLELTLPVIYRLKQRG